MDTLSPPIATTPCVKPCSETFFTNDEGLGHDEIVRFLTTNLNEEKAANTKLNTVALRKGVNAKASTAA